MRYLVDTNVLLRYCDQDSSDHALCVRAVRRLVAHGDTVCLCAQILIEHWAVATRPVSANGLGLEPDDADRQLAIASLALPCLPEPPDIAEGWREIARKNAVRGKQAHDARIAALMLAHGVTHILTFNTGDFTRYQGITAVSPTDMPVE